MSAEREREIDSRLADWVDGTLAGRERERFLAELRVNAQLRKDLAEYETTVATIREALQAKTVTTDLGDRVMAAIAEEERVAAVKRADGPFAMRRLAKEAMRSKTVLWSLVTAAALLTVTIVLSTWPSQPTVELQATGGAAAEPVTSLDEFLQKRDATPAAPTPAASTPAAPTPVVPPPGAPERSADDSIRSIRGNVAGDRDSRTEADKVTKAQDVAPEPGKYGARSQPAPVGDRLVPAPESKPGGVGGSAAPRQSETGNATDRPLPPPTEAVEEGEKSTDLGLAFGRNPAPGAKSAEAKDTAKPKTDAGLVPPSLGSAGFPAPAPERLALVLLQGDATDGLDQAARKSPESGTRGGGGALTDDKAPPSADRLLEQFFVNQMRIEPTKPTTAVVLPAPSTLRLHVVETPAPANAEPARAAGALPPVERTWLVEGSKEDVQSVLKRLAAFAKTRNLVLTTGEDSIVAATTPSEAPVQAGDTAGGDPAGADSKEKKSRSAPSVPAPATTRLLLRFRLLRR